MPNNKELLQRIRNNEPGLTRIEPRGITDADISELCAALEKNTTVTELILGGNGCGNQIDDISDFGAQVLARNTTLKTLNLSYYCSISDVGAQAFAQNNTLTTLNLSANNIGPVGAQALAKNITLRTLNLGSNKIGDTGAQVMAKNNTLISLDLSKNKIGDVGAQALAFNSTLSTLYLDWNQISAVGAQALARNNTLRKLDLLRNNISDACAQAFALNTILTSLSLVHNQITDIGAQALAKNNTLSELRLDYNQITDIGAQVLAQKTNLTYLSLGTNQITDIGAQALAKNNTLISLNLGWNQITDIGTKALARNTTLTTLMLHGNNIGDIGAQIFTQNTVLVHLNLNKSGMSDVVADRVYTRIRQNEGNTRALVSACEEEDLVKVTRLLKQGVRPYGECTSFKNDETLLHLAVHKRNKQLLDLLLAHDAGIGRDIRNHDDLTYTELARKIGFVIAEVRTVTLNITTASSWQPHSFSVISPQDYQKGEKIGVGTYGTVYKATWRGVTVALKELHLQVADESIKRNFNNEAKLLANLNHDHIIAYRGIVQEPRSLVMEFAEGGSLFTLLHSSLALTEQERLRFAFEISLAMAYLHQCNPEVIHCDLKSANVLLDKHRKVKLSDFGLSKTKNRSSSQSHVGHHDGPCGTPTHMAPELLDTEDDDSTQSKLTPKIDIYSFAILLWEMATRQIPFDNKSALQIMNLVYKGKRPFELVNINPAYKSLVTRCWAQNPSDRPTAKQVVDILKSQMDEVTQTSNTNVSFTSGGFMSMGSYK